MTSGSDEPEPRPISTGTTGTKGSTGRPEVLTPRARVLLPLFMVALVTAAVHQLWFTVPARLALSGPTMGTTWSVVLAAEGRSRADAAGARDAIDRTLARVNGLMSTWDPASELSRFNDDASGRAFALSPETFAVMSLAREVGEKSGGAFDVTVGPLVAAWGFGAGARIPGHGPDSTELTALRERVGFALVELDAASTSARKQRSDVRCDLSAIAKGYGVDEVAAALSALGWSDFLVEIGGEVRAAGERPGGGAWRVGIERPDEDGRVVQAVIELVDRSMATSGDYRSFYEEGGERLSHIVDPRTGRPTANAVASVTVLHPRAAVADAWATALTVLGPEAGIPLADAEGLAALFLLRGGDDTFATVATRDFPPRVDSSVDPGWVADDASEGPAFTR